MASRPSPPLAGYDRASCQKGVAPVLGTEGPTPDSIQQGTEVLKLTTLEELGSGQVVVKVEPSTMDPSEDPTLNRHLDCWVLKECQI